MKHHVLVAITGIFFWLLPAGAEIYRYKDTNGTIRFTDNLTDVPEKQRAGLSAFENTPTSTAPSVNEKDQGRNTTNLELMTTEKLRAGDSTVNSSQSEEHSDDPSRIDRLLKIKTALDEENAQFMKESLILSEDQKTLSGKASINAYNEKVNALNARMDEYEKRRAAFQIEADAFDAALKKRLAPPPPKPPQSSSP